MCRILNVFLNPAIDNTLWVTDSINSEPVSVIREKAYAGGKGINLGKTLDAVGLDNLNFGIVGRKNEAAFLPLLKNSVKNFKFLYHDGKTRENITVVFPSGKLLKINHKGAISNSVLSEFKDELLLLSEKSEFVSFCGRMPDGIEKKEYIDLICSLKNKKILIDTSSFSISDYEKIKPYAIKPNQKELGDIVGYTLETEKDVINAAIKLLPFCKNILVSMGEKGAVLVNNSGVFKAIAPKVTPLSDIGAGDAAFAGFIYSKALGDDDKTAIKKSVAFGTAAVCTEGTDTVKREKIEEILNMVSSSEI